MRIVVRVNVCDSIFHDLPVERWRMVDYEPYGIERRALNAILTYINNEYQQLPIGRRPWAVWIRLHNSLPTDASSLQTPLRAVWFMDSHGISARDPWQYRRFYTVHCVQPWCSRPTGERSAVFGTDTYEIGSIAFASYGNGDNFYLEMVWGVRTGRGLRIAVDEQGVVRTEAELWIS